MCIKFLINIDDEKEAVFIIGHAVIFIRFFLIGDVLMLFKIKY